MKKFLLISTGGTIVCDDKEESLTPVYSSKDLIDSIDLRGGITDKCTVDTKDIMHIDSSDMRPKDWQFIAQQVYEALLDYDGVILTHGTDTLAYTSSMLSFMLKNIKKPVVITGSQKPFSAKTSDAKRNVKDSILALLSPIKGVFVVFNGKIILGCRAYKTSTFNFDAYDSMNYPMVGKVEDSKVSILNYAEEINEEKFYLDNNIQSNVFLLKLFPGINPAIIDNVIELGYKGVIIEGFGSGNVPSLKLSVLDKIVEMLGKKIPIVLTTQCIYDGVKIDTYYSGYIAEKMGVVSAYDMTTEATVTKFMWALAHSNDLESLKKIMHYNISNEICVINN